VSELSGFYVFLANESTFFQGLRENTCSLQPAVKNAAPGLKILTVGVVFIKTMLPAEQYHVTI